MGGDVDIIVMSRERARPQLAVEVKAGGRLDEATQQVRSYMRRAGAPLGVAIVGSELRLLRETYKQSGLESIEIVGTYSTAGVDELHPPAVNSPTGGLDFEERVQRWLESLSDPANAAVLDEPLRSVVQEHIVPLIETGVVCATGPRQRAAG